MSAWTSHSLCLRVQNNTGLYSLVCAFFSPTDPFTVGGVLSAYLKTPTEFYMSSFKLARIFEGRFYVEASHGVKSRDFYFIFYQIVKPKEEVGILTASEKSFK